MRINIKGNDVTPEKIAAALAACEKDYNLKITGATVYVRFENASGQNVEPLQEGQEFSRDFWFRKPKASSLPPPSPAEPAPPIDPITTQEMMELCQKAARRSLSSPEMKKLMELNKTYKIDRKIFTECLGRTVLNTGAFNIAYLIKLIEHRTN